MQGPLQGKAGGSHLSVSQLPFSEKECTGPQLASGEANDGPHPCKRKGVLGNVSPLICFSPFICQTCDYFGSTMSLPALPPPHMGTSAGGATCQPTSPLLQAAEPQGWLPSKHARQAGWRQVLCALYNNLQRARTPEVVKTLIHFLLAEGPVVDSSQPQGGATRHLGCLQLLRMGAKVNIWSMLSQSWWV